MAPLFDARSRKRRAAGFGILEEEVSGVRRTSRAGGAAAIRCAVRGPGAGAGSGHRGAARPVGDRRGRGRGGRRQNPAGGRSAVRAPGCAGHSGAHRGLSADGRPYPLGPVVDALRDVDVAALGLSPLAGALRPLFPEWQDRLPPPPEDPGDPAAARHRQLRALVELVSALDPDVVVVDDAHDADPVTVDLLLLLASPTVAFPLVLTYRRAELGPEATLLRLIGRTGDTGAGHRVALDPFEISETAALIRRRSTSTRCPGSS